VDPTGTLLPAGRIVNNHRVVNFVGYSLHFTAPQRVSKPRIV
jgi:hypothetical protein